MRTPFSLKFLGTSSAPTPTRNYSSLLVKYGSSIIMVDCGESSQRQFFNRHVGGEEKLSNLNAILITHLHQDHVMGLISLLATISGPGIEKSSGTVPRIALFGPSGLRAFIRTNMTLSEEDYLENLFLHLLLINSAHPMYLFSPAYMTMSCPFVVHELLWPSQEAYPHIPSRPGGFQEEECSLPGAIQGSQRFIPLLPPIENEFPGLDFRLDLDSMSWPSFLEFPNLKVSAAPVSHRVPTLGFSFEESDTSSAIPSSYFSELDSQKEAIQQVFNVKHPRSLIKRLTVDRENLVLPNGVVLTPPELDLKGRKLIVLGDTSDATGALQDENVGMLNLAKGADVLVHESTNVALPIHLNGGKKGEIREEVRAKALLRGHSTPQVAGTFAGHVSAKALILNHFSARYAAPSFREQKRRFKDPRSLSADRSEAQVEQSSKVSIMSEIEDQATEIWHSLMPSNDPLESHWRRRYALAAYDGLHYSIRGIEEDFEQEDFDKEIEREEAADSLEASRGLRNSASSRSLRGSNSQSVFKGRGRGRLSSGSIGEGGANRDRGNWRGGRGTGRRSLGSADQS